MGSVVNCRCFSEAGRREVVEVRVSTKWNETSLAPVKCLGTAAAFCSRKTWMGPDPDSERA